MNALPRLAEILLNTELNDIDFLSLEFGSRAEPVEHAAKRKALFASGWGGGIMIIPRPYQAEALDAVLGHWHEGVTRQLVSLPTGCGKILIFGIVAGALKTRTFVLAHREELLLGVTAMAYRGDNVGLGSVF